MKTPKSKIERLLASNKKKFASCDVCQLSAGLLGCPNICKYHNYHSIIVVVVVVFTSFPFQIINKICNLSMSVIWEK